MIADPDVGPAIPGVLRTPDERFTQLAEFPYPPHYRVLSGGLRMHYLDEGQGETILCLHGEPSWCYLYRKMIPTLAPGHRVVAPDLIGFGRSDKFTERSAYTFEMHLAALRELVTALDLRDVTLVCQDWGGLLGLPLAVEMPDRFARLVIMNTGLPTGDAPKDIEKNPAVAARAAAFLAWRQFAASTPDMDIGRVVQGGSRTTLSPEVVEGYNAPFPDARYKAGAQAFPLLVPITPDDLASEPMRQTREKLKAWTKPALVVFSDSDPITKGGNQFFRRLIPSAAAEPEIVITGAGHFLQEDRGEEIAEHVVEFVKRRPVR